MVTMDAGLPVAEGASANDEHRRRRGRRDWPPTVHIGPYDSLNEAHTAVEKYLHEQDCRLAARRARPI